MNLCVLMIYDFFCVCMYVCVVDQHSCMLLLRSHIEFHRANALDFSLYVCVCVYVSLYLSFNRIHIREREKKEKKIKQKDTEMSFYNIDKNRDVV